MVPVRGAVEIKNVTKSGKSQHKKSKSPKLEIRNLDFLSRGEPIFSFFPKCK